ncbi:MAG: hypothetical protein JW384_03868 [Nitrosomonadaceae bacterium]|nr:hypothetical protein [Nitrosomonadaceae bacterium]
MTVLGSILLRMIVDGNELAAHNLMSSIGFMIIMLGTVVCWTYLFS